MPDWVGEVSACGRRGAALPLRVCSSRPLAGCRHMHPMHGRRCQSVALLASRFLQLQGVADLAVRLMRRQTRLRLSEQEWAVLKMGYGQGQTYEDISQALNVSVLCLLPD